MIAEQQLEMGEVTVDEVGRVGDTHFDVVVSGEQQRQLPLDAQVCTAQPFVGVMTFACFGIGCPLLKVAVPFLTPFVKHPHEGLLVGIGEHIHNRLQLNGGHRLRMLCEILAHGLLLMELAQLHILVGEHRLKTFPTIKHHRRYHIPHTLQFGYALGI